MFFNVINEKGVGITIFAPYMCSDDRTKDAGGSLRLRGQRQFVGETPPASAQDLAAATTGSLRPEHSCFVVRKKSDDVVCTSLKI
jgi:hypothetical protein